MPWEFEAELWLWEGQGGWHFVTLPEAVADDIADLPVASRRGFGSVRVEVTVGAVTWRTSVFPDAKRGSYVLPVKKDVRRAEGLDAGDRIEVKVVLP